MEAGCAPATDRETAAASDTTVECDAAAAACGVVAAAFGVAVADCGVATGCVTTIGCTRTAGSGLVGDSSGILKVASEAADDGAPAAFEVAQEAPKDFAI